MTDADSPLIRHEHLLPDESWDDPSRGNATWRTFFSRGVTPTAGLTTGIATIPVGGVLVPHRHQPVEDYYVVEGSGIVTLGEAEVDVRSGSAVHIPSLVVHGARNTGTGDLRFLFVFAADSFEDVEYDFDVDPS